MADRILSPPLLRWDGPHLVLDLALVERHLQDLLRRMEHVCDVTLAGRGAALRVGCTVRWKGVRARVGVDLTEIRLRHRRLGFRLHRFRILGGVPVPRAAVESIIEAAGAGLVTVFRGEGIVIVDLRQWLPPELELTLLTVQASATSIHLWLGPGSLRELPHKERQALPPGAVAAG